MTYNMAMLRLQYSDWIGVAWCIFLLVWLVTGLKTKRAQKIEAGWRTGVRSVVMFAMLYFLYFAGPFVPWLRYRVIPNTDAWHVTGVWLTFAGIAFAVWARFALGTNWSAKVTIKEDHQLIVRGPYRIVRNPIYSGMYLAMIGTALAMGQLRHFLALPLMATLWTWKTMHEQKVLRERFGTEYDDYCRRVKAIIPYVV